MDTERKETEGKMKKAYFQYYETFEVILEKIKDNLTEIMNLGERNAFCRGFSLAVRLMVEAMTSEKT